MGKPVLIFTLHMKVYPRMLDRYLRLEVDRIAHLALLKCSNAKPSSNIFWSVLAQKFLFPSSELSCISSKLLCEPFIQLFSVPAGNKKKQLTLPQVQLPSVKGAPPLFKSA